MKLLLVVNPISGGKSKDIFIKNAESYCYKYNIQYEYFKTTGENDVEKLRKVEREGEFVSFNSIEELRKSVENA